MATMRTTAKAKATAKATATAMSPRAAERRRRTHDLGRLAEALCRLSLRLRGYRILGSRVRTPLGEIDIVARRRSVLAVVEVKARPDVLAAGEAVSPRQRQRLARAARLFLGAHPRLAGLVLRFDVMLVTPWSWPRHIEDAWKDVWRP
jgi:putative endonuclease